MIAQGNGGHWNERSQKTEASNGNVGSPQAETEGGHREQNDYRGGNGTCPNRQGWTGIKHCQVHWPKHLSYVTKGVEECVCCHVQWRQVGHGADCVCGLECMD